VSRLRWWREVAYVLAFYSVYTLVRNTGVDAEGPREAFANAKEIISVERATGLYHEESIQDVFLGWRSLVAACNVFYGTAHFIVTAGVLVYLFRWRPERYPLWRNVLACTTALALIGFALYPLMPPRLLPPSYGFVDTLKEVGGLWSFDSSTVSKVSNQYAAMPSLHFGWALWSVLALLPSVRRGWARALLVAYPGVTLFVVVVTANHFVLDAVAGAVVLGVGFLLARPLTAWLQERRSPQGPGHDPAEQPEHHKTSGAHTRPRRRATYSGGGERPSRSSWPRSRRRTPTQPAAPGPRR
jgi:amino acid transporter